MKGRGGRSARPAEDDTLTTDKYMGRGEQGKEYEQSGAELKGGTHRGDGSILSTDGLRGA